jgi:xylan 1,4-beta-xylosidase
LICKVHTAQETFELKNLLIFAVLMSVAPCIVRSDEQIVVDPSGEHHGFPHFWEQMFGSGRALLSLRESYRRDLRKVKDHLR